MILVNYSVNFPFAFSLLKHSDWNGCTIADIVFPFFLFAVGSALVFSKAKVEDSTTQFYIGKVVRRAAILFFFGIIISWAPFIKFTQENTIAIRSSIRIMGILQRIALCYFIVAMLTKFFKENSLYIISISILLFYWFIVYYYGDNQDPYGISGFAGIKFDLAILGKNHVHLDKGIMLDPEGLLSTTSAIVVVIAGFLFSNYVVSHKKNIRLVIVSCLIGIGLIVVGLIWGQFFPINKKMWTSSYTVFTTGIAIILISIFIYWFDIKMIKNKAAEVFEIFGKNPLFIFLLSEIIMRFLNLIRIRSTLPNTDPVNLFSWMYIHSFQQLTSNNSINALLFDLAFVTFYWLIARFLDKRKIYFKV